MHETSFQATKMAVYCVLSAVRSHSRLPLVLLQRPDRTNPNLISKRAVGCSSTTEYRACIDIGL